MSSWLHRALRTAVVTGVLALAISACTSKTDSPRAGTPGQNPDSPTATATPTATPSFTSSPSASSSPLTLTDRLLATAEVPGLNATWHWQDGETGPANTDPFGSCARADLTSIGATQVVQRTYFPPDDSDDFAAEQIADFPDAATTARAVAVLDSWRKRCSGLVKGTEQTYGPRKPVPIATGTGSWYLVSFRPQGGEENRYNALGTVVNGSRIALLLISNGAQRYAYPAGQEPMVAMVQAAATHLE